MKKIVCAAAVFCGAFLAFAGDGFTWNGINFGYQWDEQGGIRLNYAEYDPVKSPVKSISLAEWQSKAPDFAGHAIQELDSTFFTASSFAKTGTSLANYVTSFTLSPSLVTAEYASPLSLALCKAKKLTSVNVPAQHPYYVAADGVLYKKGMATLLFYPAAKAGADVTVRDGVSIIERYAFKGNSSIKVLRLPASVKAVQDGAFEGMAALQEIYLPRGLKTVGTEILKDCPKLKAVYCSDAITDKLYDQQSWASDYDLFQPLPRVLDGSFKEGSFAGNATYLGWVCGTDGALKGTLNIVAAKPNKKTGLAKTTATYVDLATGAKTKTTAQIAASNAVQRMTIEGVGTIAFSEKSVKGVDCDAQAGLDASKVRDAKAKAALNARLAKLTGTWTFATREMMSNGGYGTYSLAVKAKGKAKVTGTTPFGKNLSLSATGVLGDDGLAIPVLYSKNGVQLGGVVWVDEASGELDFQAFPGDIAFLDGRLGGTPNLPESTFHCWDIDASAQIALSGKKFVLTDNPDKIKLTYNAKTGLVKGSVKKNGVKYTLVGVVVPGFNMGTDAIFCTVFGKGNVGAASCPMG